MFVAYLQYLLPQHFLSGLVYRITRISWPPLKDILIRLFIRYFNVNMSIAIEPEIKNYKNFNTFFTRSLKPETRPIEGQADVIVSPVDGSVSETGRIIESRLLQAKNKYFSLTDLLAGDDEESRKFRNGAFCTLYLSPRDYHRIHMPVAGTLQKMLYVPGKLFSVSPSSINTIDRLFARNERVINIFNTDCGTMALIMVGALCVGSMETVWAGQITPAKQREILVKDYAGGHITFAKGAEIGRFNMGSTVILLFPENTARWSTGLENGSPVTMGAAIGEIAGVSGG